MSESMQRWRLSVCLKPTKESKEGKSVRRTDALVPPVEVGRGGQVVGDGEGESSAEDTGEVNRVALEERPVEKLEGARSERASERNGAGGRRTKDE